MEREFLNALNWFCYVDQQSFMDQLTKFEGLVSINEFLKRSKSNMTYTELLSLFDYLKYRHKDDLGIWNDITDFVKSICIYSLAYCVALAVLMMSFSIVFSMRFVILSQQQANIVDNFTLEAVPFDSFDFNYPLKYAQIQTNYAPPHNFTFESLRQNSYHVLKLKHNRLLKCS